MKQFLFSLIFLFNGGLNKSPTKGIQLFIDGEGQYVYRVFTALLEHNIAYCLSIQLKLNMAVQIIPVQHRMMVFHALPLCLPFPFLFLIYSFFPSQKHTHMNITSE